MKKLSAIVIVSLLLFKIQAQQACINKTYSYLPAAKACMMNDIGYVFATTKNTGTVQLISLVQLNFSGDTLWQHTAGLYGKKYDPVSLLPGPFGGFVVTGTVYDSLYPKGSDPLGRDFFLTSFSDSGVNNGINVYGKSYIGETMGQCILANNGDYILTGQSYRDTTGSRFYAIRVKFDSTAATTVIVWENSYASGSSPAVHSAISTADGGVMIAGEDGNGLLQSPVLLKIATNGALSWKQTYNLSASVGNKTEAARAIINSKNKGYTFIGTVMDLSNQSKKPLYIVGVDSSGNVSWKKAYGKTADVAISSWLPASQVVTHADSTCTFAGNLSNFGFIMQFNTNGDSLALKLYQRANNATSSFSGIVPAQFNGYLLCGHTGGTLDSAWMVKVDCMLNDNMQYPQQPNCCIFAGLADMDYKGATINLCKGDSIIINAYPVGLQYHWNTGATTNMIKAGSAGTYAVTITSSTNCIQMFTPATVIVDTVLKPVITRNGNMLHSNYANNNHWYQNGSIIDTSNTCNTNGIGGTYTVVVANTCGSITAQPLVITGISTLAGNENEFSIYPNPFTNELFVKYSHENGPIIAQVKDITGRVSLEQRASENNIGEITINTAVLNNGMYIITLVVDNRIIFVQKLIKIGQ